MPCAGRVFVVVRKRVFPVGARPSTAIGSEAAVMTVVTGAVKSLLLPVAGELGQTLKTFALMTEPRPEARPKEYVSL